MKDHDDDTHDYDHEAFLGEEAAEFEELDPGKLKRKKCEQHLASWNKLPACHSTYEK